MKKIILITLTLFICQFIYSQEIFQKTIPGFENSISVSLPDGGSVNASHMALQTAGIYDIVFTRHNSIGQLQFTRAYGSSDQEQIYDGAEYQGNYYFCGELISSVSSKGLIIKLDGAGNLIWAKTVPFATKLKSISVLSTGHLAITGTGKITSGSDQEITIQKFDINGNMVWGKYLQASSVTDIGNSVIEFGNGGILVVGKLYDGINTPLGNYQAYDASGNIIFNKSYADSYFSDVFYNGLFYYVAGFNYNIDDYPLLVKINSLGDTLSTITFGANFSQSGVNNAFIMGNGIVFSGNTFINYYILKTDFSGNKIWQKEINNSSFTNEDMNNAILTANNKILITSNHINGSMSEMQLTSGDETGDFGCNSTDLGGGYWQMNDPHTLSTTGSVQNISGSTNTIIISDLSCAIVDQMICSSLSILDENSSSLIEIYPNPFTDQLFINNGENNYFEIVDLSGKNCLEGYMESGKINTGILEPGVYILRILNQTAKIFKL